MNRSYLFLFAVLNTCACWYYINFWRPYYYNKAIVKNEPQAREFTLTEKWQHISKDQPLPKGVHVRINLATGEREAKLLDNTEGSENNKDLSIAPQDNTEEIKYDHKDDVLKYDYIKEALKNIKSDLGSDTPRKAKFKTYEQLKKELSALEVNVKTDAEILNELLAKLKDLLHSDREMKVEEENVLVAALTDLEYLLHQIDNAQMFAKHDGMSDVIIPCLESNSTRVRQIAARVLGSAVQNNGMVQILALESGVIPYLLRTIALEKSFAVRSSSLYALSCLIRSFPFAQLKFVESGGLSVFISLFDEKLPNSQKLQLKSISFLSDLLQEKLDADLTLREQTSTDSDLPENKFNEIKERLRQYESVNLAEKLVERGWCQRLAHFLVDNCYRHYNAIDAVAAAVAEDAVEHDVVDSTANALLPLSDVCKAELLTDVFKTTVLNLNNYYAKLWAKDKDDVYFDGIYKVVRELATSIDVL